MVTLLAVVNGCFREANFDRLLFGYESEGTTASWVPIPAGQIAQKLSFEHNRQRELLFLKLTQSGHQLSAALTTTVPGGTGNSSTRGASANVWHMHIA